MFLRQIFEDTDKTAVFAFGRMNPPTVGHKLLADKIKQQSGDHFIFLSQTQKPKTDPLSFAEKVFFADKTLGGGIKIGNSKVRTIIDAMKFLEQAGYKKIIYVAGSDRVNQFSELLQKYNGKEYNFNEIQVVNAGERDPDADGAEGMSASKMRQAAIDGDYDGFEDGVAINDTNIAKMMYSKVRKGMGLEEIMAFMPGRSPKRTTIKKKTPKQDDALGQKVQDRLKQYRKQAAKDEYKRS